MKKVQIPRKLWLRGNSNIITKAGRELGSLLYRKYDKKMCCMGIYLHACGVPLHILEGRHYPKDIKEHIPSQAQWTCTKNKDLIMDSEDASELVQTNDEINIRWNTREKRIKETFAKHDVEITIVP